MNCKIVLFVAALVLLYAQSAFAQTEELSDTVWTKFTYPVEIRAVKFTPDGRYLVTGGSDAIPKLWDVETGELVKAYPGRPTGIWTISIANNMLAFFGPGENGIQIYNLNSFELIKSLQGSENGEFTTDGKYMITGRNSGISVIDVNNWEEIKRIDFEKGSYDICISKDNNYIARSSYWSDVATENKEGSIEIYSFPDLKLFKIIEKKDYLWCKSLAFSPDGKYLAGAISDSPNKVWNTSDWKLFKEFGDNSYSVTFSKDNKFIVIGGGQPTNRHVYIRNLQDGNLVYTYPKSNVPNSLDVSPDNKFIAASLMTSGIIVYNAKWNPTSVPENSVLITEPLIFPNPANKTVNIRFNLVKPSQINIEIYDISSIKVADIYEGFLESGLQNYEWNISSVPSGSYFARITAQGATSTVKIIISK